MLRFVVVLLASVLLFTTASAQGTWFQTGTLTTRIGGVEREHNTYGTLVPEDVAEGVEDPQQRAILERIAGTEQHTASYMLTEEMALGSIVLTPATLWVALTFYFGGHDSSAPHGVTMQLPLDPVTLELSDPDQVEITYYPSGPSWDDYYALTDGSLTLTSVEVVNETTLRIAGSFSGYFSHQTEYDHVHDPATAVEGEGEFVVEQVVGSQLALELLEEEAQ